MEPKHPLSPLFLLLSAAVSLLMLSAACGRSSQLRDTLQRAENLMEEHPDSAYALLAPLRVDTNDTPEDQALHALLLTQAMHKTYRIWRDSVENIAFSDSLIRIAVDHYEKNNNDARLMVSYYYQGEIEAPSDSNFLHAIVPLSRSLEIVLDRKDNYWIARNSIPWLMYISKAVHLEMQRKLRGCRWNISRLPIERILTRLASLSVSPTCL